MWYRTILAASDGQLTLPLKFPEDRWKNKLFHGTTRDNYDSIKRLGLQPGLGSFVEDMYAGEYDVLDEDNEDGDSWRDLVDSGNHDAVYLAQWADLQKSINAMLYQIEKQIGRKPTMEDIKKYGLLLTASPESGMYRMDQDGQVAREWDEDSRDFTGYERYENPLGVERTDIYTQDAISPQGYYQGGRLKSLLGKFQKIRPDISRIAINRMVLRMAGLADEIMEP